MKIDWSNKKTKRIGVIALAGTLALGSSVGVMAAGHPFGFKHLTANSSLQTQYNADSVADQEQLTSYGSFAYSGAEGTALIDAADLYKLNKEVNSIEDVIGNTPIDATVWNDNSGVDTISGAIASLGKSASDGKTLLAQTIADNSTEPAYNTPGALGVESPWSKFKDGIESLVISTAQFEIGTNSQTGKTGILVDVKNKNGYTLKNGYLFAEIGDVESDGVIEGEDFTSTAGIKSTGTMKNYGGLGKPADAASGYTAQTVPVDATYKYGKKCLTTTIIPAEGYYSSSLGYKYVPDDTDHYGAFSKGYVMSKYASYLEQDVTGVYNEGYAEGVAAEKLNAVPSASITYLFHVHSKSDSNNMVESPNNSFSAPSMPAYLSPSEIPEENKDTGIGCYTEIHYNTHSHTGSSSSGGGCYGGSETKSHYHSGSSSTGGGCYSSSGTYTSHKHTSSCSFKIKESHNPGCPGDGDNGRCPNNCGVGSKNYTCGNKPLNSGVTYSLTCSRREGTYTTYYINCGKTAGAEYAEYGINRYALGCGRTNGQLVEARIKY